MEWKAVVKTLFIDWIAMVAPHSDGEIGCHLFWVKGSNSSTSPFGLRPFLVSQHPYFLSLFPLNQSSLSLFSTLPFRPLAGLRSLLSVVSIHLFSVIRCSRRQHRTPFSENMGVLYEWIKAELLTPRRLCELALSWSLLFLTDN